MNKQQLASKIWESANQMRSRIEANEYKDYILGFIFYKYLSDKEKLFAKKEDFSDADVRTLSEVDTKTVAHIKENIGYFIAYENLFSTWIERGSDFDVSNVREALSAFNRLIHPNHKRLFEGIFKTLETGLSELGDTAAKQTKAISELIQLINQIPMDDKQGYDVLGFIYEYLIGMFAANAGKKAGEFYTPHEVSLLMSEIIAHHVKGRLTIQVYDSTSGSGSLLLNIGQSIAKHMVNKDNIKYYAQELKENTYNLTRMNLIMRGILPNNIVTRCSDTLEEDWPFVDEQDISNACKPLYLDAVVSNPPYSQKWDTEHKDTDPRYANFGVAPKSKSDYAFLLHDLYHLKPDGIVAIVLPHGVLSRGGDEGTIRKNLIENDHIEAIIGLPPNIFFGTPIPTTILILRQKRVGNDVLIVDASKGFEKAGKNNKLRASDIKKIVDTVIGRSTVENYSRLVSKSEIQEKDYNLNIPRYVDSAEPAECWDLYASMFGGIPQKELDSLDNFWQAFPNLRAALFAENETPYVTPKVEDIAKTTGEHFEVTSFKKKFSAAINSFSPWLSRTLLEQMLTLHIPSQESLISDKLFATVESLPLCDRYHAYEILDKQWQSIAGDLEILQTEGFAATRMVVPNIVEKVKNGQKVEAQEGWKGHTIPFDLVQSTHHKEALDSLRGKENRLSEIAASLVESIEGLGEEEKAGDIVNEAGDKFVASVVAKEAKALLSEPTGKGAYKDESYEAKIIQVAEWLEEEKALKASIKKDSTALHMLTKSTIEGLSSAAVHELLELKWVSPLSAALQGLPDQQINILTAKLVALVDKYSITYAENAREIQETEAELGAMLDELVGDEYDEKGLAEMKIWIREKSPEKAMLQKMFPRPGSNVPEIRFKGFSHEWGKTKMDHCLQYQQPTPYLVSSTNYNNLFKTPVLTAGKTFVLGYTNERHGIYKDPLPVIIFDDFTTSTQFVGFLFKAKSSAMKILRAKDGYDIRFMYELLQTTPYVVGTHERHWISKFAPMQVVVPQLEEQQKIGNYFRTLDNLINKHEIQLKKLKNIKSACLEKMFA